MKRITVWVRWVSIKKKRKFSSYIRKFGMEQLQRPRPPHIWGNICAFPHTYIRKPFLIYDFATAPLWIPLFIRKIWFSSLSVCSVENPQNEWSPLVLICSITSYFWLFVYKHSIYYSWFIIVRRPTLLPYIKQPDSDPYKVLPKVLAPIINANIQR
jgi:hypothetical protein